MVLGGAGQGGYSDASWATAYVQSGPWESLNPSYPAVPSQVIEGALVLTVAVVVLAVPFLLRLRIRRWRRLGRPGLAPRRDWAVLTGGRRYLTVLGLWAIVRFAAAFTWRDARVLGPFTAEQLILLLVAKQRLIGSRAGGLHGIPARPSRHDAGAGTVPPTPPKAGGSPHKRGFKTLR